MAAGVRIGGWEAVEIKISSKISQVRFLDTEAGMNREISIVFPLSFGRSPKRCDFFGESPKRSDFFGEPPKV